MQFGPRDAQPAPSTLGGDSGDFSGFAHHPPAVVVAAGTTRVLKPRGAGGHGVSAGHFAFRIFPRLAGTCSRFPPRPDDLFSSVIFILCPFLHSSPSVCGLGGCKAFLPAGLCGRNISKVVGQSVKAAGSARVLLESVVSLWPYCGEQFVV